MPVYWCRDIMAGLFSNIPSNAPTSETILVVVAKTTLALVLVRCFRPETGESSVRIALRFSRRVPAEQQEVELRAVR